MTKQTMNITVNGLTISAHNFGYDTNGNRKWVVWFGSLYHIIADQIGNPVYDPFTKTGAEYRHVLNALHSIGGKKFHNRKFGGGIVITGSDISTLGKDIETAIATYVRWYNSENVAPQIVEQIAKRIRHQLPVVVKSTNSGFTVSGDYFNGLPLKIKLDYDHNMTSTDNYVRAALLWINKAEYKRWQLNECKSGLRLSDVYTALDANTRVFTYTIEGY